ncbi:phytoene desaturase family protein [Streptomyces indicus]|uniref:Phytoene dehydrogenase-related protein n=1 Tax=Streptomyces indicus TaxID=417292 RepID=A0A1G9J3C7_9ACTN|nr:FAD-dependent oxidoreductase [Streptomyces indicus]SDL32017.1 Phytoene dehydrogenase-related protein [Streptomyces indicus]
MSAGADEQADAVVVGAGLTGLVAAVRLAQAARGRRVLLLEAGAEPGGRARTTEHHGFRLGLGPRALYRTTRDGLRALGVRVPGRSPDLGGARALRDGVLHPGYAAAGPLLRTPLLTLRERVAVARLLGLARGRSDLAGTDAAQWLGDRLPTERARQAAFAVLRISSYTGRPDLIGADALSLHFAEVRRGVEYVDGGWRTLTDALLARARELGVELRTGWRCAVVEGGPRPRIVSADGHAVRSRSVVLAGLPQRAAGQLLGLAEAGADSPAARPLHTACLDVALSRLPDPRSTLVFGVDEPLYLSVFSRTARLAPQGGAVVHLARYDDGSGLGASEVRKRLYELLDLSQPGWRDAVVHERFLPRITTMTALPEARTGGLTGRPGVRVPGHQGVFVAGDWVGPHGLLADACVLSATRAAEAAAARL